MERAKTNTETSIHREPQTFFVYIPLEEKQIEVVVFLGKEVAKDTSGVPTADLISW